jgi:hypothetical protein
VELICLSLLGGEELSLEDASLVRSVMLPLPQAVQRPSRYPARHAAFLIGMHMRALADLDALIGASSGTEPISASQLIVLVGTDFVVFAGHQNILTPLLSLSLACQTEAGRYAVVSALTLFDGTLATHCFTLCSSLRHNSDLLQHSRSSRTKHSVHSYQNTSTSRIYITPLHLVWLSRPLRITRLTGPEWRRFCSRSFHRRRFLNRS